MKKTDGGYYKLSKDYELLFCLAHDGCVIVGFIDCPWSHEDYKPSRDVVKIKRHRPFEISINARGVHYGGVYPPEKKTSRTEQELFVEVCEALNLEWIEQTIGC